MEQLFTITGTTLTIHLPAELDHHSSEGIRGEADRIIRSRNIRRVLFDFEKTVFMDSSGIGIIIGRYRKISSFGGKVYAIHADDRIQRILIASGMTSIIEVLS